MRVNPTFPQKDVNSNTGSRSSSVTASTTDANTPVNIQKHDAKKLIQNPNHQNTPTCSHHDAHGISHAASTPRFTLIKRRWSCPEILLCKTVESDWQYKQSQSLQYHNSARRVLARKVRSWILHTSSSDSTPSPPRRRVHSYYTRRYRKRLYLYRALAVQRRQVRLIREAEKNIAKAGESSPDFPAVKGTTENLETLGLLYQKEKRKRSSSSGPSPPERKTLSRKIKHKSWHRQLDCSSTDSPVSERSTNASSVSACSFCSSGSQSGAVSDIHTPSQTGPLNRSSVAADPCTNKNRGFTSDQTVLKQCSKIGGLKQPKSKTWTEINFLEISSNIPEAAANSPSGILKMVKFEGAPSSGGSSYVAKMQVAKIGSKSEPSVQRIPNTLHVTKPNKKVAGCPKGSAATKVMVQPKTYNETTQKSQINKISLTPKVLSVSKNVPLPKLALRCSNDPQTKNVSKTSSHKASPAIRSKDAQALKIQSTRFRPENPPSFKISQTPLKCLASSASLNNPKTITPTPVPFRKPDTPRPKTCPESLKWKKTLELRTKTMGLASADMSRFKGQCSRKCSYEPSPLSVHEESPGSGNLREPFNEQNLNSTPIIKSVLKPFHENKPDDKGGIMKGQDPARGLVAPCMASPSAIQATVQNNMVEQQKFSKPHPSSNTQFTTEMPFSTSSQMIGQAIISAITFIMKIQPGSESITITCSPCPSSESSPFKINDREQTGSKGASVSRCQFYSVKIEPLEPDETSQGQDTSQLIRGRFCGPMQGEGDNGTNLLSGEQFIPAMMVD
ncbi:uncharacterized protein LOC134332555 [Trichomycterus rosablanca]|uniref:uncharacterized protein LOC134332555 n=1 Tax=Trichomycterus rosablanca TaxID=2290929 RepID=UPI002F3527F7